MAPRPLGEGDVWASVAPSNYVLKRKRGRAFPQRNSGARSFVTAPRAAGPRRQVKSTLQRDNYLPRETKHLLLSMYRHQGNMLEILSTSNTWRARRAAPSRSALQQSALKYALSRRPFMCPQLGRNSRGAALSVRGAASVLRRLSLSLPSCCFFFIS